MPLERGTPSTIDVLDRVLDKGIVVDYWARISVLGVDILTTIEARIVVASLDTYLHYGDAIRQTGTLARSMSARAYSRV